MRGGEAVKRTEARWGRFTRSLAEFKGWSARLRVDFGAPAAEFVVKHRFVEHDTESPEDVAAAIERASEDAYELTLTASDDDSFRTRVVETATGSAQTVTVPTELLASPIYANLRRVYAKLVDVVGAPPPHAPARP